MAHRRDAGSRHRGVAPAQERTLCAAGAMSFSAFVGLGAYQTRVSCGYCGSDSTAASYGFYAALMTVEAYEAMLNRGWRR
jgi:hypothetical protein